MILNNKLGPGAKIVIRRSGDVIPKLDKVLEATEASFPPKATWTWDGVEADAVHIKTVTNTTAVNAAKLQYFLKSLEIPGAGPATAVALIDAGIIGPAALWAAMPDTLSKILGPKTGASLYTNLRTTLAKVSELTLMHASCTMPRGVGDTKLASLFAVEADPRKWATLTPPAGWTTDSFKAFLRLFHVYTAWRTEEVPWIPYPIMAKPVAKPVGETICMTGFRDKELEKKAAERGHILVSVFTGKVTILLVPDGPEKLSEKVKAAKAKGTKILSRSRFVAQYLSAQ